MCKNCMLIECSSLWLKLLETITEALFRRFGDMKSLGFPRGQRLWAFANLWVRVYGLGLMVWSHKV